MSIKLISNTPCLAIVIQEISDLLNTGLDRQTLSICVQLCEAGINPEALAFVIQELRREVQQLKVRAISSSAVLTPVRFVVEGGYYGLITK